MRIFQSIFDIFKILAFIIFLSSLTNIVFANTSSDDSARIKKADALERQATNYLISTLKKLKVYSVRHPQFPSCVNIITDEATEEYIIIELREVHDGSACKGDPNVTHMLDSYKVTYTKPMNIYWFNSADGKYLPILESIDLIK